MGNKYCVYMHTSPSGKVYIGITSQNPERRWRSGRGYFPRGGKENSHFANAIQKYGWDNFKHQILYDGISKEEACEKEIQLIKEHKAQDPQYGYNELSGGNLSLSNCSKAVKEKMRNSAIKKWQRDEYKASHTGENHWTSGGKYSEKAIEAMRKATTGMKRTPEQVEALREKGRKQKRLYGAENKHSVPVICMTETGEFVKRYAGLSQAYRETGVWTQNISKACHGIYKTAGGYKWRFEDANQNE